MSFCIELNVVLLVIETRRATIDSQNIKKTEFFEFMGFEIFHEILESILSD